MAKNGLKPHHKIIAMSAIGVGAFGFSLFGFHFGQQSNVNTGKNGSGNLYPPVCRQISCDTCRLSGRGQGSICFNQRLQTAWCGNYQLGIPQQGDTICISCPNTITPIPIKPTWLPITNTGGGIPPGQPLNAPQ